MEADSCPVSPLENPQHHPPLYCSHLRIIMQFMSSHHRLLAACCGCGYSECSGVTSQHFLTQGPSPAQHQHLRPAEGLCYRLEPDSAARGSRALHGTPLSPAWSDRDRGIRWLTESSVFWLQCLTLYFVFVSIVADCWRAGVIQCIAVVKVCCSFALWSFKD